MASHRDDRMEHALRNVASNVVYEGAGTWRMSFVNGAVVPARLRASNAWIDLTADLPGSIGLGADDVAWLRVNAALEGSARVARRFGQPMVRLRSDVGVDHGADLIDGVTSACVDFAAALAVVEGSRGNPSAAPRSRDRATDDIARACWDAGWPCSVDSGQGVRVEIKTRAGVFTARIEPGADVVRAELADLAGSFACQRAVAALLLTVSNSVRSVKAMLQERDGVERVALVSPIAGPCDSALDRALSALAVACQVSGREVQALSGERLAAEYLSFFDRSHDDTITTSEEHTCLQQP